jgi:hypothetical protein
MTSRILRPQNQNGRQNARPSQIIETPAIDEITESLIQTFPASDPPAWVALTRVGIPKRRPMKSRSARKARHL